LPAEVGGGAARLVGRRNECAALDQLAADVLAGRSQVIVLRGDAGAGKSALLGYLSDRVAGWHVARAVGVESEMELAYSSLHQLCIPMLDRLDLLPAPQRDALATVFGLTAGTPPDRFLVGLATLTLLAEVAEREPLACIVDDAHWLDRASAQIIGFVARRLLAERVAVVCAARTVSGDDVLGGLPELSIEGLGDSDARALLLDNVHGPLDAAVCDQIVAESHGNPLTLLELPRTWSAEDLAGGFGLPRSRPVAGEAEQRYVECLRVLPADTRLLVLAAAAEPLGDPVVLHHAAETLGIDMAAAGAAEDAGLLQVSGRVEFAHPLVRSAVYHSAAAGDRRRVHRALADATDPERDPDRRAWHRARATPGPDEDVATELERSAGRAQSRGGIAAAAVFLRRSVALTHDPSRRTERALAAAHASMHAGTFDAALGLLAAAEGGSLDELQSARSQLLRGQIAFASSGGSDAPRLLLNAAKRLERLDLELARETYLDAWGAALFAGELATAGGLVEVSRAAMSVPLPASPRASDLLLDALATLVIEGRCAAASKLRQATSAFTSDEVSPEKSFRWGWLMTVPANVLWDDESRHTINVRQVELARDAGALVRLPIDLTAAAVLAAWRGDFASASDAIAEADAVTEATGACIAPCGAMLLAALRGRETEASRLIESTIDNATSGGQGIGVQFATWAAAILFNGLGKYEQALAAARRATDEAPELFLAAWALPELIEASVRVGETELGLRALDRLTETTAAAGTDWALGIEARSRALLSKGELAERAYREAIDRLGRTRLSTELARAHLLFGEWLRRENRRADARTQLYLAHELLIATGMEAFAERARIELLATGERVRRRVVETRDELTPQEFQIARLARDGLSNPEIGARLFISSRTVEWHLRKVFTKLAITSRKQLRTALPEGDRTVAAT
jgi:DNA-binding CsgD family transcriptional regulator